MTAPISPTSLVDFAILVPVLDKHHVSDHPLVMSRSGKLRVPGADRLANAKNENMAKLIKPDDFILGLLSTNYDTAQALYVMRSFQREHDFEATSVNHSIGDLLQQGGNPT